MKYKPKQFKVNDRGTHLVEEREYLGKGDRPLTSYFIGDPKSFLEKLGKRRRFLELGKHFKIDNSLMNSPYVVHSSESAYWSPMQF